MAEKKKKAPKAEQDELTIKIPNLYKKKCEANGVQINKTLKEKLDDAAQNGKLQTLQLWEELGPLQIRSLMEALIDIQYPHLKKIRFWKIDLQDEGVRAICNYIEKVNSIEFLDLMDNKITPLGCEFLGKMFLNPKCNVIKFRIDNNPIGDEGIRKLSLGLRVHSKIQKLSFNYCNITAEGVKYIQQIIANIDCHLRTLKLQGNPLGNVGAYEALRAVKNCGQYLQKLNLADVGMNILNYKQTEGMNPSLEEKIGNQIICILQANMSIAKYNFKNNWIPDIVAKMMLDAVKQNKNIFFIDMPDCIAHVLKELQNEVLKKRKLRNRGKKGKGKRKSSPKKSPKKKQEK